MKNVAVIILLSTLAFPCIAQKVIADYPLKGKPQFAMRFVDPWPTGTMYFMRSEQPCTVQAITTVAGKEMEFIRYEVSLDSGRGTVDAIPGHPDQFIITPKATAPRSKLYIYFHATTPGYRLMNPIRKSGFEGRLYDEDGKVIPTAIQGWEPVPNVDPNGRFLIDRVVMTVLGSTK